MRPTPASEARRKLRRAGWAWGALALGLLPGLCRFARADEGRPGAPAAVAPFADFRDAAPGRRHRITASDLPAPYATASAGNAARLVSRPGDLLPSVPAGFRVNVYAEGLAMPRVMRRAPNGDIFLAESGAGRVRVFRGLDGQGRPASSTIFATGLQEPYGIAFYPPGNDPQWVYLADARAIWRVPYHSGDLRATAPPRRMASLPEGGGHWTRDLQISVDGRTLYVGVGSASNVNDPDENPAETNRADILAFDPDGSHMRVYAYGIRNPSGLAIDPDSGRLWCAVNERDGLGDNLVPDYITEVREGGFYGWPWWYTGAHQDPRHAGKHPELRERVIVPDVLLQPHSAPLQLTFYDGARFPASYRGNILATAHGSWNRSVRTGYEVLRVPRQPSSRSRGDYEDFMTGFVLPDGHVWGRPVGIATAADGSLLVSDDGGNVIWRVDYAGR